MQVRKTSVREQLAINYNTNTDFVNVTTDDLYSKITLEAGTVVYNPFSYRLGDTGVNLGMTNVTAGNVVPAKQGWILEALKVSVITPTPLTAVQNAKLLNFLFSTSVDVTVQEKPQYKGILGNIMGISTAIQTTDAVGASNLNSQFDGGIDFGRNQFEMDEQTTFSVEVQTHGVPVDSDLEDIQLVFAWERELSRIM